MWLAKTEEGVWVVCIDGGGCEEAMILEQSVRGGVLCEQVDPVFFP